jgi:hypothetical protein
MTLVRPKTILTFSFSVALVTASAMSSDARPHAKRLDATQQESVYYNYSPIQDNSCFRSTGLPEMYACSSHGG